MIRSHHHHSPTSVVTTTVSKRARRTLPAEVRLEDFYQSPVPHPYGVLPGGNRFLVVQHEHHHNPNTTKKEDARVSSTTSTTSSSNRTLLAEELLLTEECWNSVLSFLDGPDLGRMVQTCRFLYVAAHQPEFWRDLVLQQQSSLVLHRMGPSWKDTYVLLNHESWYYNNDAGTGTDTTAGLQHPSTGATGRPHQPMAVPGIYSDYYYRLHSCRSFTLPKVWWEGSDDGGPWTVPKIPVNDMTSERFVNDYERPNRPVVIQGAALQWNACRQWADPVLDPLGQTTTTTTFRATSGVAAQPAQFTWQAYQQYCCEMSLLEEGPLYLFDRTALQPGSSLWHDYMADLQRTCPYWDPQAAENNDSVVHHDLLQLLGEGRRPDHTWLIVGPPRSGSVFHLDPNATHAWNATITGRKRWIFYPPGSPPPPGVHPSPDGDQVALPWTVGEWILQFWNDHLKRKHTAADPQSRPLEVTSLPGDVVFVPHGWWHMVVNLENDDDNDQPSTGNMDGSTKMNIAITHNYVSASNLSNVLKFLDHYRDQVSGCRDRPESIKPETLYEEFVAALEQTHPQLLAQALAEPDWTCPAWKKTTTPITGDKQENASSTAAENETQGTMSAPLSVMDKAKSDGKLFSFSFV